MSEDVKSDEFVETEEHDTEWHTVPLGDNSYFTRHSGDTPTKSNSDYWGGEISWLSNSEVQDGKVNLISNTQECITKSGLENCTAGIVPENSVILSCTASIGKVGINQRRMATNQQFNSFEIEDGFNSYYLANKFLSMKQELETLGGSTTHNHLSVYLLDKVEIEKPPVSEQRKIATVLYTVDQAIEKVEEIKSQIQRIRDGVRQDVFLYGIPESGTERTEGEIKETYLGTVPEDWQLRRVDEVCSHVVDCPHSTPDYSDEGIPVVRTSEVEDGRYYPAGSPRVDEEGYQKRISRLEPKPGDVVFTREAPIGESFKIPDGMKLCLGQRLMQLRPEEGVLDSDFLVELLYSDMMQSWFERSARGTTSTHVNVGDIESMEIPVPPIEEQHKIVDVLGGFREKLNSERHLLNRYERLKHGLMQDLLSGTVRTTDTDIDILDDVIQYG